MSPKIEARSARVGILGAGEASILIVKNSKYGVWELPGGTKERGETILTTAVRELHEETGLELRCSHLTYAGATQYWGRKSSFHECTLYYGYLVQTKGTLQEYPSDENILETRWIDFYNPKLTQEMEFHPLSQFALYMLQARLKVNL